MSKESDRSAGAASPASIVVQRRIEWSDTDASGNYHNSAVFRLIENAETALLDRLGFLHEVYGRLPRVHISAQSKGGEWLISVKDNGIGIEPQYAEKIFGIFRVLQPRDKTTGNGMGLAICRKIVSRHEGRIWVESALGKGATFYFTLPKK